MNSAIVLNKISSLATASSSTLSRVINPLWRILTFSIADDRIYPAKALCVSLEKGIMSIAYGSKFLSGTRIKNVKDYPVEESRYPLPEVFASSLSLAVNELGASGTDITLSIPKLWAVVKTADFPSAARENLSNVVSYELDRITPFSSEDAYYDFRVLGEKEGKISLLVVAAKEDLVRPYIEAAGEKGLRINRLTFNLSGIETFIRYAENKTEEVFLEISQDRYEGAIFLNGLISGAFSEPFNTEDYSERTKSVKEKIEPLMQTLKLHEKPERLTVLFKDRSPSGKEILKAGLPYSIRMLGETGLKLKMRGNPTDSSYSAVGGLLESLWTGAESLDLLCKGSRQKTSAPFMLTFVLLVSILIMWVMYIVAPLRVEGKRLQEIDRQIAMRKEEVKKIEALKKDISAARDEITLISDFKQARHFDIDLLKNLTAVLPRNAWFSRVRITDTAVELEGYASESATGILSKLEASPYFKKVEFSSPTFRDTRLKSERFNIKMEIEGLKKEPPPALRGTGEDNEEE